MPIVSVNPEARYDEAGSQARKNPSSRKRAWNNQKEVLAKKQGPREPFPQAPRMGIHPPVTQTSGNPSPPDHVVVQYVIEDWEPSKWEPS